MNDVILNKKVSIERCIRQINDYYRRASATPFQQDYLRQDAIAMNLQRAAELTIDIANRPTLDYPRNAISAGLPSAV